MFDLSSLLQGFILGTGIFLCPGPKDILFIREALSGRHPAILLSIGVGSDTALIALGMLGLSAAISQTEGVQAAVLWLGIVLLLMHGLKALRSAWWPSCADIPDEQGASSGLRGLLLVSFLNPAAWLDTVLIIGTVGSSLGTKAKPVFAAGAVTASLLWFIALLLCARRARSLMTSASVWRRLDAGVALLMLGMAIYLASSQWQSTGS